MPEDPLELLRAPLLRPPDDFAERVLSAIAARADESAARPRCSAALEERGRDIAEWLAVAATVLLGLPQLAIYLFGVWTASGAG